MKYIYIYEYIGIHIYLHSHLSNKNYTGMTTLGTRGEH